MTSAASTPLGVVSTANGAFAPVEGVAGLGGFLFAAELISPSVPRLFRFLNGSCLCVALATLLGGCLNAEATEGAVVGAVTSRAAPTVRGSMSMFKNVSSTVGSTEQGGLKGTCSSKLPCEVNPSKTWLKLASMASSNVRLVTWLSGSLHEDERRSVRSSAARCMREVGARLSEADKDDRGRRRHVCIGRTREQDTHRLLTTSSNVDMS